MMCDKYIGNHKTCPVRAEYTITTENGPYAAYCEAHVVSESMEAIRVGYSMVKIQKIKEI